jgi:nucleotide-binding universal stress UspA family protein
MTKLKVLIPLDGSEFSRQIIGRVRQFLRPDSQELTLLRVSEAPRGLVGTPPRIGVTVPYVPEYDSARDADLALHPIYQSQKMDSAISELSDELRSDRELLEGDGFTVHSEVRFGDPAQEIVAYATEASVDLIAMTTHGRHGLLRAMTGSVASYVLRHASVPIFLYRPTNPDRT